MTIAYAPHATEVQHIPTDRGSGRITRTYLATLADGGTRLVTVDQGYIPGKGGEIARVKAAIALPIRGLAIVA